MVCMGMNRWSECSYLTHRALMGDRSRAMPPRPPALLGIGAVAGGSMGPDKNEIGGATDADFFSRWVPCCFPQGARNE